MTMGHHLSQHYQRGVDDAKRGKSPIFRQTEFRGIVPTIDDDMSDNWDHDARLGYLLGYEEESERQQR